MIILLVLLATLAAAWSQNITTTRPNYDRVFYAESYGAKANDTTDDRAAIQRALDAAYTAGGGIVQLGLGTYYANEWGSGKCLFSRTGVILRGQGMEATTLMTNPRLASTAYNLIAPQGYNTATTPYGAEEMHIEDLGFDCTMSVQVTSMSGASATYASGAETLLTVPTTTDVAVGDAVTISGSGDATYNSSWTVTAVPSGTTMAINKTWGSTTSTGTITFTKAQLFHNHLGIVHCPKAIIRRCGFDRAAFHYGEINLSKNVLIEDCRTIGTGNCGGSKWQLDNGSGAGIMSTSAKPASAISNAATYASGGQTLLTVASTAAFTQGEHVLITSANGASAATYNAAGGYRIAAIVSSTTVAIDLAWPGNATTAGTLTQTIPVKDVVIARYNDSIGRTDKGSDPVGGYEFLHLSHGAITGTYRNITLEGCVICAHDSTAPITTTRITVGFDTGALPLEYSNLTIRNNNFIGGQSTITDIINLHSSYSATYNRKYQNIIVEGNTAERCAFYHWLSIGDKTGGSDTSVRTSITAAQVAVWNDYTVRNNTINIIGRTGGSTTSRTPGRPFNLGAAETAVIEGNTVIYENQAPILNPTAWTSASNTIGFLVDHPRNLVYRNNIVEAKAVEATWSLYCHAHVFGCGAYEINSGPSFKGHWIIENNLAIGTGSGVGSGIANGFTELTTAGTTGVSSWLSSTAPNITGVWRGNFTRSAGTLPAHTLGGANTLAIPGNGSLSNAARNAAYAESPSGTNPGRHRWGYGPRYGTATLVGGTVTVADVLITANTNIQVTRSTAGGTTGHYQITRNVGQDFTITSSSGTDTSTVSYLITEPN